VVRVSSEFSKPGRRTPPLAAEADAPRAGVGGIAGKPMMTMAAIMAADTAAAAIRRRGAVDRWLGHRHAPSGDAPQESMPARLWNGSHAAGHSGGPRWNRERHQTARTLRGPADRPGFTLSSATGQASQPGGFGMCLTGPGSASETRCQAADRTTAPAGEAARSREGMLTIHMFVTSPAISPLTWTAPGQKDKVVSDAFSSDTDVEEEKHHRKPVPAAAIISVP